MSEKKVLFVLCGLIALFILLSACATTGKSNAGSGKADPYGTWVNPQYDSVSKRAARIAYRPDGIWLAFDNVGDDTPMCSGTVTIWETWRDGKGCTWCKVTTNQIGLDLPVYELWKIGCSGTVLEGVWKVGQVPLAVDPGDPTYSVYYRPGRENRRVAGNS
jgi:hypothetical protein